MLPKEGNIVKYGKIRLNNGKYAQMRVNMSKYVWCGKTNEEIKVIIPKITVMWPSNGEYC